MWIAEAKKKTARRWRNKELSWEQFCHLLEAPMRTKETLREYKAMSKSERDVLKELPGGFVGGYLTDGIRKTANVRERSMVTLDADHARPIDWGNFTCLNENVACVCYSTHSSTPDSPRLRWIFPASRPILPDEYPAVSRKVATWVGIDTIDPTTHDLCRLFYYPGVSADATYVYHVQPGAPLDVDAILASYGPEDAWKDSSLWPIGKDESEPKVTDRLKRLGDPGEKPGIVGLFCRTFSVYDVIDRFLPNVYEDAGPDRYTYTGGSTAGGARVYNGGAYLYSSHATDPAGGYSCNAFDLVRLHKFGHLDSETGEDTDVTRLPSYKAMADWAVELPEVKAQMAAEKQAEMADLFGDLTADNTPKTAADDQIDGENDDVEDMSWTEKLDLNKKTGECEPSIANALLIMLNDPALKGALAYDMFAEAPKLRKDVPWRPKGSVSDKGKGTLWIDRDESGIRWYLQTRWHFKSENDLKNALELAFHANEYHPVREYLNGLTWDGVERLDTMFIDMMGAEDNAYVRSATRKWMCGAVARVMRPGCKFDQAIVLNSRQQGIGKSTFSQILSRGWYSDSAINMNDKEGYSAIHGSWIIELAELASTKRSDVETVKTFLSKREDTYRPAYARRVATFPRQCVFFGTTNETEYLKDRTGNRRFWAIDVNRVMDQEYLESVADQLWAEAVVRWKAGERLWITDETVLAQWQETVDQHTVQDDLEGQLLAFLDTPLPSPGAWSRMSPEERRDWINEDLPGRDPGTEPRMAICLLEIKTEMLREDRAKNGNNDLLTRRLANLMNNLPGWYKEKKRHWVKGYGQQWVYRRKQTDLTRWKKALKAQAGEDLETLLS